jgi:hypothetical protein
MKVRYVVVLVALGVLASNAVVTLAITEPCKCWPLAATLTGKNEVGENGRKGAGDSNGRGGATIAGKGTKLCWGITVKDVDTPSAAHIHRGTSAKNGPVVVELSAPTAGDIGSSSGCTTVSSSLNKQLLKNPSHFYVNVHTANFPDGAVRGQLKRG